MNITSILMSIHLHVEEGHWSMTCARVPWLSANCCGAIQPVALSRSCGAIVLCEMDMSPVQCLLVVVPSSQWLDMSRVLC
jgi:hypothetical protein